MPGSVPGTVPGSEESKLRKKQEPCPLRGPPSDRKTVRKQRVSRVLFVVEVRHTSQMPALLYYFVLDLLPSLCGGIGETC